MASSSNSSSFWASCTVKHGAAFDGRKDQPVIPGRVFLAGMNERRGEAELLEVPALGLRRWLLRHLRRGRFLGLDLRLLLGLDGGKFRIYLAREYETQQCQDGK